MSKYVRHKKVDANQPAIVKELRALGYSVSLDHDDIIVGWKGRTYWFEIKVSEKSEVKESQKKLLKEWKGHYKIVWTTEMIIKEIENAEN
jgi:hypothetical protein